MKKVIQAFLLLFCLINTPTISDADDWRLWEKVDDFTDENISKVRLGRHLHLQCNGKGGYRLWFDFNGLTGSLFADTVKVRYRFGKGDVFEETWRGRSWKVFMPTNKPDFSYWLTSAEDFVIEFERPYGGKYRRTYENNTSQRLLYVISGCIGPAPK